MDDSGDRSSRFSHRWAIDEAMGGYAGRFAAIAAALLAAMLLVLAPSASAKQPSGSSMVLEITPGGGPQITGGAQTVEAQVTQPNGDGADGVEVDFEITEGPGDLGVGTAGDTPQMPDMTCITSGGSKQHPATCTVSYTQPGNVAGTDAVRAWIDTDRLDSTVEADMSEGVNQHAPGADGCHANSKGAGDTPEPDGTACVEKRWKARVATAIDLEPETGAGLLGDATSLQASVFDQFGNPFQGPDTSVTVGFTLLPGSAGGSGDIGSCDTGTSGGCSVPFTPATAGVDQICAWLPGAAGDCSEPPDAPERDNGADVVLRTWTAPVVLGPTVTPPAPDPAPQKDPPVAPKPEKRHPTSDPSPGPDQSAASPDPGPPPAAAGPAPRRFVEAGHATSTRRHAPPARRPRRAPAHRHAHARSTATHHARRAPDAAVARTHRPRHHPANPPGALTRRLRELSKAAVKTANRFSFPLILAVLVVAFLAVQGRIDRRDPKLRLAPVDSKHDLIPFT
jgi:hypothetical protein